MRDGVMVLDAEGKITYANPALAVIFSVPLPDVIAKRPLEVIRLNELAELIDEVKRDGQSREKEMQIVYPQSRSLAVFANRSGEGIAVVVHDITETRKLENLRSEFVANVSHELKTPLTAIRNYAETLLNGALEDNEHNTGFVAKIEKHAENLSALIDDLLEISQLEARRGLGEFMPIIVARLIEQATETISDKARKKRVEIIDACGASDLAVSGIEEHLLRALLNLLDNAVNYTEAGGSVTIACGAGNGKPFISVADSGIGIAPEHLPRLFERFYRVDKARSRDLGGTGLGLAIVKHVMNLHDGTVMVESEVGKGSKFTLVFPAK
jgi:two-component system phosphate regulon sensor histidine kinase PhoR